MDEILSRPPGIPRDHPTPAYWQMPLAEIADLRTTEHLPGDADIVIIGSGISGATIAYNLLSEKPDLKIVMLEARQAASGASGRNGGHTKHASYKKFMDDIERSGVTDAVKIAKLEFDTMRSVHAFIKANNIDADSWPCESTDIYYDKDQWAEAHEAIASMKKHIGQDSPITRYDFFSEDETSTRFLTPNALGSIQYEAGSVSAYKLTIGILKLALAKGLNLQTNTAAQSIKKTALQFNLWTVTTPRGQVTAPRLVLATNGYTAQLYPKLQGKIVPLRGIVSACRPGSGMPQTGLEYTYSFGYTSGYDYMISRPKGTKFEGDIVMGGGFSKGRDGGLYEFGNTDDTTMDPDIEKYLYDSMDAFFGKNWGEDNPEGRVRMSWSGIMGYSADGYPFIGELPQEEGLWIDASFQGHGMVLCFLCAKAVSEMIMGRDGTELDAWFPQCFRISEKRMQHNFDAKRFEGLANGPDVAEGETQVNGKH